MWPRVHVTIIATIVIIIATIVIIIATIVIIIATIVIIIIIRSSSSNVHNICKIGNTSNSSNSSVIGTGSGTGSLRQPQTPARATRRRNGSGYAQCRLWGR
jgi:hypothetical protein